jgi:hypothetical protein
MKVVEYRGMDGLMVGFEVESRLEEIVAEEVMCELPLDEIDLTFIVVALISYR